MVDAPLPAKTRLDRIAPFVPLASFLGIALAYATQQSLWVDEATQLSGIRLPFAAQLDWLLGARIESIRVPSDRTPPLSYWIGRVWYLAFGPGELAMRLLGVTAALCGLIVLFRGLAAALGHRFALAALAFSSLFPGLIVQATEIRPYGLLFMFSVLVLDAFLRVLRAGPTPGAMIYLYGACVGATFTHYFGLVVACATLCVLAATFLLETRKLPAPLMFMTAAYFVTSAALAPFVAAALHVGAEGPGHLGLVDYLTDNLRLAYRLVAHQTMKLLPAGDAVALICATALLAAGFVRSSRIAPALATISVLVVGFAAVSAAALLARKFDPLQASYNVWMIPFVAVALAQGTAPGTFIHRVHRLLPTTLFTVLLGMFALGDLALVRSGPMYGHTRSQDLRQLVDRLGADNAAVVYLNRAGKTYFPMHYWYGDALRQYVVSGDGFVDTVFNEHRSDLPEAPFLIVAATRDLGARELNGILSGTSRLEFPQRDAKLEQALQGYRLTATLTLPAQEALLVRTYSRVPAP